MAFTMSLRLALNLQQSHVGLKVLQLQLCTTVSDQRNGGTFGVKLFFQSQLLYVPDNFSWTFSPLWPPCIEYIYALCTCGHMWAFCRGSRLITLHLTEEGGHNQIQSSLIWPTFLMCTSDLPACMSKCRIHAVPMETRRGGSLGPGVSTASCH